MLKLIKEESVKVTPIPNDEEVTVETNRDVDVDSATEASIEEIQKEDSNNSAQEIPEEIIQKACQDSINGLVQEAWGFISHINSTLSTIDYDYKKDNKEQIIEILNSIVNDVTVSIGMLYSAGKLIDITASELMQDGEEKAEDLIANM